MPVWPIRYICDLYARFHHDPWNILSSVWFQPPDLIISGMSSSSVDFWMRKVSALFQTFTARTKILVMKCEIFDKRSFSSATQQCELKRTLNFSILKVILFIQTHQLNSFFQCGYILVMLRDSFDTDRSRSMGLSSLIVKIFIWKCASAVRLSNSFGFCS